MHPILFHIGSFAVHSYGVLIMLGFSIGMWRALRLCRMRMEKLPPESRRRVSPDAMFDIGFYGLIWGMVGARLFFVLLDWQDYSAHPLKAFALWEGGLTLQGAMLFGILFLVWYCKKHKVNILAAADIAAVSWPLAYAIGRIGCLLNGCCYGAPTSLPWGIRFPDEDHPGTLTPPSHPIQLYATLINLCFFWWLVKREKRPRQDGLLFWIYIAMYGAYRCAMEPLRIGGTSTYDIPSLHLTYTEIVSFAMVVLGMCAAFWLKKHRTAYTDDQPSPILQQAKNIGQVPINEKGTPAA